ncbi:MAG: tetratricopeptide repeat protein [Planctomycetota bacterium]
MTALWRWVREEIARMPTLFAILALVAATAGAYANSLDNGFHFDDTHHIVANPYLRSLDNLDDYFTRPDMFSALPGHEMYRPILLATFALNYHMGGYDPLPWRLTALALHAICAVGVFLTIRVLISQLQRDSLGLATGVGFVAALFFALHPVFTETVNYASARSSLLATAFVIWAFLLHRWALDRRGAAARLPLWIGSLALFLCALLSKEIAVVLPFVLLFAAFQEKRGYWAVVPSFLVLVLYLHFVRGGLLGSAVMDFAAHERAATASATATTGGSRPILWNLYTQARVIPAYLSMFVLPIGFCADRYVRISDTLFDPGVWFGGTLVLALLYFAWRWRRTRPLTSLGLVWFFFCLAPTSSVIPLNVVMNEHRLYLPGLGVMLILADWLRTVDPQRVRVPAMVGAVVLAGLTLSRNTDWRNSYRLWGSAVAVSPKSAGAWNSLGVELGVRGEDERAIDAYKRAVELDPASWQATFNLGTLHLRLGTKEENPGMLETAESWIARSLEIMPSSERSRWFRAEIWWQQGKHAAARAAMAEIASESPRAYELTRYPLARMAAEAGDLDEAHRCYEFLLRVGNDPVGAHLGLARLAYDAGNEEDGDKHVRAAMQARPHDASPHLFLARRYAGTRRATGHLFEAERRGYRASARERDEILSKP